MISEMIAIIIKNQEKEGGNGGEGGNRIDFTVDLNNTIKSLENL